MKLISSEEEQKRKIRKLEEKVEEAEEEIKIIKEVLGMGEEMKKNIQPEDIKEEVLNSLELGKFSLIQKIKG